MTRYKVVKHFIIIIILFITLIVSGSLIYQRLEGLKPLDALYFTTMTITTVGYGDITPITDAGKTFTIIYSIGGIAVALYLLFTIGRYIVEHHVYPIKKRMNYAIKRFNRFGKTLGTFHKFP